MPRTFPRTAAPALAVLLALCGCSTMPPQVGGVEITASPGPVATTCSADFVSVTAVADLNWPAPFVGFAQAPDCFRISTATFDGDASRTDLEVQWLDRSEEDYAALAADLASMGEAAGLEQKSDSADMAYWTTPEGDAAGAAGTTYDQGFLAFQDGNLVSGRFLEIVRE